MQEHEKDLGRATTCSAVSEEYGPNSGQIYSQKMNFHYTVPAFEFAPEACKDQSYSSICKLFRSFRVKSSKCLKRQGATSQESLHRKASAEQILRRSLASKAHCSREDCFSKRQKLFVKKK